MGTPLIKGGRGDRHPPYQGGQGGSAPPLSRGAGGIGTPLIYNQLLKGELTGVNKRLDNLEFTNRTIFVAIVTALMAGLVKLFFPNWLF
ncbi:MAG: hypothetical protein EWV65_06310 [Microcystis flos-aquae Ma_QC_C_20070823_S18D]|nr:MAG: hypothetical protein EWV65_06310 [Microcystis flos-aquae Ma_QC_C_20070823_S18D]